MDGGSYGRAYAINDAGVIVGTSSKVAGDPRPIFVVENKMIDVGLIPATDYGVLTAVNKAGIAVGLCWSNTGFRRVAVATRNRILDLGSRIEGSPYLLQDVWGIDDAGNIVGTGVWNGEWRAVILRPE